MEVEYKEDEVVERTDAYGLRGIYLCMSNVGG